MPPRPSPAPSSLPTGPAPLGRRLREVPGGYDLDTLPIRVDVHDGESPVSWLRRLSARYDTPARDLLKVAGARKPVTGTSRVAGRLRNYPGIPQRRGLPADQVRHLVNPKPLAAATAAYIDTFHRGESPVRPQSRYCPRCLAGLAVASALVHDPDLLILDEPTNALDPAGVIELRRIIAGRAQQGVAVFVSSHHLDEMARLASVISVIHDGRIIDTLPPDGVDLERQFFRTVEAAASRVNR